MPVPEPTLTGKRVLITGANGGLGLATTTGALRQGAHVTLACRTDDKAREALGQAVEAAGVGEERAVAAGGFDMLAPEAIEDAVSALPATPFDVVFLQAGGWVFTDGVQTNRYGETTVERTLAKNVVGAHATVRALLASGRIAPAARIVIIGGEGARGVPGGIAKPEFTDVQDFERYLEGNWTGRDAYVPINALGVAKLGAALWAQHLALAQQDHTVVWFTPGLIAGTGGTRGMPAWKEFLFQRIAFPLLVLLGKAQWPQDAARKCLDCLAGRVGHNGDLLGAPDGKALGPLTDQKPMNALFTNKRFQEAMWATCEAAAGAIPLPQVEGAAAL